MKEWYEKKVAGYKWILAALDEKALTELAEDLKNLKWSNPTDVFLNLKDRIDRFAEIRELITTEIEYCTERVKQITDLEKPAETEEQA